MQVCNIDREKVEDIDPKNDWTEGVTRPSEFSVGLTLSD